MTFEEPCSVRAGNTQAQRLAYCVKAPADLPIVPVYEPPKFSGSMIRLRFRSDRLCLERSQQAGRTAMRDDLGRLVQHVAPLVRKAGWYQIALNSFQIHLLKELR